MVGGVLVERTVQEVLPALVGNRDKMGKNFSTFSKSDVDRYEMEQSKK